MPFRSGQLISKIAVQVPSRFFLFRAQPFMVADSLKMAISQRLVKKVCPRCYVEEPVPSAERLIRVRPLWQNITVFRFTTCR